MRPTIVLLASLLAGCAAGDPVASPQSPPVTTSAAALPESAQHRPSPLVTRRLAAAAVPYATGAADPETLVKALYCYVVTRTAMEFAGPLPADEAANLTLDLDVMRAAARGAGLAPQHRPLVIGLTAAASRLHEEDQKAFTADLTWCLEAAENFLALEAARAGGRTSELPR